MQESASPLLDGQVLTQSCRSTVPGAIRGEKLAHCLLSDSLVVRVHRTGRPGRLYMENYNYKFKCMMMGVMMFLLYAAVAVAASVKA